MLSTGQPVVEPVYRIKIYGVLDTSWSAWFDNLTITHPGNGITCFQGSIRDQSALFGFLMKIHNMGLFLYEVKLLNIDALES